MTRNEAQTRRDIIDKRLIKAGWDINNPQQVALELNIFLRDQPVLADPSSPYAGHLFADYAILDKYGKPIAVIEAKRTSEDAEKGKKQALEYAEKIAEIQNIPIPLIFYTNGYDIYFWDSLRYPPRKVFGFPTMADIERILFLRDNAKPLSSNLINPNISGRPYQIQAIRSVLERMEQQRRKFLLVMATGTGKTRTCMGLLDVLMCSNWTQKVLFLVDRVALAQQAIEAIQDHLPNAPFWPKQGEKTFKADRRIYVTTYPTMLNLIQQDECPLNPHYFDLVVADESHRSIYNVYKNIFDYFDAVQLGLTATPKDYIDHNTFGMFDCENEMPTFAYSFQEAVDNVPPYLCNFEAIGIQTKFQTEGINSETIAESDMIKLVRNGEDPDLYNFEGTDLEKKVSNRGTNTVIVREFMEECIKDPNGVLPGKSIFFAISKKHAYRLCEVINNLYPEYKGRLAEVILSDVKGVHGKGGLLDQFKNYDMPRIAISVDMLDTGIDVRELVNLVFAKPVFSYTKFWQMIGRGTRILELDKIKPWCPEKDKFLIMDCWKNFEYFKMKPKGKEPTATAPLPVRLFWARLEKWKVVQERNDQEIQSKLIEALRRDIKGLPQDSVGVLDNLEHFDRVSTDQFWSCLSDKETEYLMQFIAPLMRFRSNVDFKAMRFELDCLEASTAKLSDNYEKYNTLIDGMIEKISELPLTVNQVAIHQDLIEKAKTHHFWAKAQDDDFDQINTSLGPLMRFRDAGVGVVQLRTDLQDLLTVKETIEFGPENESMSIQKYRSEVETTVQDLLKTNPVLQKLVRGDDVTEEEIQALADLLSRQYPHITEYILREIYDNRTAKFIDFIRHILSIEPLATFTETVSLAFDEFIKEHNNYGPKQIQFLLILKTFILERGQAQKRDLIEAPFTNLHPEGVRGVFKPTEIDEILGLMQKIGE